MSKQLSKFKAVYFISNFDHSPIPIYTPWYVLNELFVLPCYLIICYLERVGIHQDQFDRKRYDYAQNLDNYSQIMWFVYQDVLAPYQGMLLTHRIFLLDLPSYVLDQDKC